MHVLEQEFDSAAQLSKRPSSVWKCLWGHAFKRSPGTIARVGYCIPVPDFYLVLKKHYNGLINQSMNLPILPQQHLTTLHSRPCPTDHISFVFYTLI